VEAVKHLYDNKCHDEASVWCGDRDYFRCESNPDPDARHPLIYLSEAVDKPEEADCRDCLRAMRDFGQRAAARLMEVETP
jgi:hypothetical protein